MLRTSVARCTHFGLLWWILCICGIEGLIEIVEEQRCYDYEFRLTCRELDSHIAILEAWYTTIEDYHSISNTSRPEALRIRTENDSELDRVYIYSSPKQNGVYEPTNNSIPENDSNVNNEVKFLNDAVSELKFLNDSVNILNDTVDVTNSVEMGVEFLNMSEGCGAPTFARSYGSWREGDKLRRPVDRSLSINLRSPVSYRCTGVNHCSFILKKDYNPAVRWTPGLVYIKYACFDDTVSLHYCNREVRIADSGPDSEGYIRTPGYPHFYIGEDECRWQLQANPEQRIQVTLIDVSLRSIGPFENQCTDYITLREPSGAELVNTCDQVEQPVQVTTSASTVDIIVDAKTKGAFPKRGVLLHYKSVGCVTLPAPSDGYLVYRNEDVAHYMCNVNFVFADSRRRARVLWCFDGNRWNDTVPLCVDDKLPAEVGVDSAPSDKKDTKIPHNEANMIVDIVIPCLLIAALFIGNAFVVLIIYKYRKRLAEKSRDETRSKLERVRPEEACLKGNGGFHTTKGTGTPAHRRNTASCIEKNIYPILKDLKKTDDLDEEFNTIPLSGNGAVHSAGNAV